MKSRQTLITSYVNPDLDGVASAIAYGEFLRRSGSAPELGIFGHPHVEVNYVFDRFAFELPPMLEDASGFDEIILVDVSELALLTARVDPVCVIEIIDHRKVHEAHRFPNAVAQIELVGAAATLIAEKFIDAKEGISRQSAILLFSAIVSNTLNFRGTVTTDRDRRAAAWLNETAQLPEQYWRDLFIAKSDLSGPKLRERIEQDFADLLIGDLRIGISQLEIIGAEGLLKSRGLELRQILESIKNKSGLDRIFQNTIELEDPKSYIVAYDLDSKAMLNKALGIEFTQDIAATDGAIMRKQIIAQLKARFSGEVRNQ